MSTPNQVREEFHKEFQFAYEAGDDTREKEIDWWLAKLEEAKKEAVEKKLEEYSRFLEKNFYMDSDWYTEEPTAIERFLHPHSKDESNK